MNTTEVEQFFAAEFGAAPDVIASAAGRVNLLGEHVDYNGGEVLPIAIERRTWIAVRQRTGDLSRVVSASERDRAEFDAGAPVRQGGWWDYVAGVSAHLVALGAQLGQFELAVVSDVPQGAGLSSSAALEVATATALATLAGSDLGPRQLALVGWHAETEFVGVPSGLMDQFASAMGRPGHALHIWSDTGTTEQVPFAHSVLIFDTAVPRSLRGSAFARRRAECEEALRILKLSDANLATLAAATPEQVIDARLPEPLGRRALHVSRETRRVALAVEALKTTGAIPGELMFESQESLRLLFQASTPELDWFVEHAAAISGVRGARLTGAGWGGCAIATGDADALAAVAERLPVEYESAFGLIPRVWLTAAEAGSRTDLVNRV